MESGWTDALFPVGQALAGYDALLRKDPRAPIALQLGDLGHAPAANHPDDVRADDRAGQAFFDAWLKGKGAKPRPGAVTALHDDLPEERRPPAAGRTRPAGFADLARGSVALKAKGTLAIDDKGASARSPRRSAR